jgi:hypothetical protein
MREMNSERFVNYDHQFESLEEKNVLKGNRFE